MVYQRSQNFVLSAQAQTFCALARSSLCSSTNISCSGMIEFVLDDKYFVLEHELDRARAQTFRAREQSSCPSTTILCLSTKFRAQSQNVCARAEKKLSTPLFHHNKDWVASFAYALMSV